ncbi:MAG: hypothetical protein ACRESJ_20850 [Pseudomonas sp.]|uniref:hypothetical protein n=1 Tax=Pseudomonas sp. TaxID=306 RepID=UPI003D6F519A
MTKALQQEAPAITYGGLRDANKSPVLIGLFYACLYPSALSPAPNGNQQEARVLTNNRNPP